LTTKSRHSLLVRDAIRRADALEAAGDLEGAVAALSAAIEEESDDPWPRALRGRIFKLRTQWRDAIKEFDDALKLKPRAPTTLFFRGQCRAMIGDFDGALADCRHQLRWVPFPPGSPGTGSDVIVRG